MSGLFGSSSPRYGVRSSQVIAPVESEAWTAVSHVVHDASSVPAGCVGTFGSLPWGNTPSTFVDVPVAPVPVAAVPVPVVPVAAVSVLSEPVAAVLADDSSAEVSPDAVVAIAPCWARRPWADPVAIGAVVLVPWLPTSAVGELEDFEVAVALPVADVVAPVAFDPEVPVLPEPGVCALPEVSVLSEPDAPVVTTAPAAGYPASTGRMFITALRVRLSRFACPGTVTTSWDDPSIWTCAPTTPEPLTRRSMMSRAWFIDWRDRSPPSTVCACSVTLVPPCRSMPSLGDLEPGSRKTIPYSSTVMPM